MVITCFKNEQKWNPKDKVPDGKKMIGNDRAAWRGLAAARVVIPQGLQRGSRHCRRR
jgi:hypothetical protein